MATLPLWRCSKKSELRINKSTETSISASYGCVIDAAPQPRYHGSDSLPWSAGNSRRMRAGRRTGCLGFLGTVYGIGR